MRGTADNPMTQQEVEAKALDLLPTLRAQTALASWWTASGSWRVSSQYGS